MEKRDYLLHSVKNAMRILRLFSMDEPELGVTQIASRIGLNKSSTHRLISTLLKEEYLEKNERNSKYRLGLSLLGLHGVITNTMEIYRESLPILQDLVEQLGETVHINVLEGNDVVYLHKVECKHPVRLLSDIGKRNPAYCSSAGKVILAYQSEDLINTVLHSKLIPYGPNTITVPKKLRENLMDIKRIGYSIAIEELHEGVVSIAVPVRDYTENVVAAISVVGPTQRMLEHQFPVYIQTLNLAGMKLSEQLGFIETIKSKLINNNKKY
ncbi:HTH-type transcriptional regulator XynR [Bacillus rhizoplanae]|uniref:HTH-type transcriptional regulator XynR n=1 Tax=Bacillus rhizoplanae TaxID=2880966 RepID=A0ABM8YGQ1_9BACI|nr:IclR family transcriptional regulator [Bacillus rhizoplanae]CAG9614931.1 HTH-type transcriptional regulator XynR [Bacillus rhizoplanae]